ncbi:zinc finger protein ZFP2-like [Daphnia carinata]|uniref:zinc finger protein ZFP2-like n=1 Tax=Daphnia carinata TaxID=120202 RepID=UPI00257A2AB5|nr:zinc finger protein ZFP2-like [Daphnia carinata]
MEPYESSELDSFPEDRCSVDTILRNLPLRATSNDSWCSSENGKSEYNKLFLVTYDETHTIVSKHRISLEVNLGREHELQPSSSELNDNSVVTNQVTLSDSQGVILTPLPNEVGKTSRNGTTCELVMQKTDTGLLQPIPYEVKLAALNAMIPSGACLGQTVLSCSICTKAYNKTSELKAHISRHFGLHSFLCPVCGQQFSHSSNLNRHLRVHSGAKPYKCQDCDKRFSQANSLHAHQAHIHVGDNKNLHRCPLCGRLCKTWQLLKHHCKIYHEAENRDLDTPPTVVAKRKFYCSDCGESFALKSLLRKHKEIEKGVLSPKEPVEAVIVNENPCAEIQLLDAMDSIDSMLREIQHGNNAPISMDLVLPKVIDTVSQTIEDVISKISKLVCFECGKQFRRYMSYKQHWGVHETSLRKFQCKECGMAFAWKSTYVKHTMQFHSPEPRTILSCSEPDCKKEYKSLSQLQEHIKRDHYMIRRFTCEECNKQFYKAHDLLVHKRTHSKDKPYMCGTCGKSFSHISHVIRHEKSHNNIRPHTCPVCRKSFTQATVLRAHRRTKCPDPVINIIPNQENGNKKT